MKKNRLYIIFVSILLILTLVIVFYKGNTDVGNLSRNICLTDTTGIDRIEISDSSSRIILTRSIDGWYVNKQDYASEEAITLLLNILTKIEMKSPVAKSRLAETNLELDQKAVVLSVFRRGKVLKGYKVGKYNSRLDGTEMKLINSTLPCVVFIPGSQSDIKKYIPLRNDYWSSKIIFKANYQQIKSISIEYPLEPKKSFIIIKEGLTHVRLFSLKTNKEIEKTNTDKIQSFLFAFEKIEYYSFEDKIPITASDSILESTPQQIIELETNDGKKRVLKTYLRLIHTLNKSKESEKSFDPYHILGCIDRDKRLVLIKYIDIDLITKELDYFLN